MKPTEIEAEQVVSTSGLLTGRPTASSPQRVSALLWKTNTGMFFVFLHLHNASKATAAPPCSHTATLHSRQPRSLCAACTVLGATPTQTDTRTSAQWRRGGLRVASEKTSAPWRQPLPEPRQNCLLRRRRVEVFGNYHQATPGHFKAPLRNPH